MSKRTTDSLSFNPKQLIAPVLLAVSAGVLLCLLVFGPGKSRPAAPADPVADSANSASPEAPDASEVTPAIAKLTVASQPIAVGHVGDTPKQTREELEDEMRTALKSIPHPPAPPVLSEPVRILTGADGPLKDYHTAINAMRRLTRKLSADDVAALREFIAQPMPEDGLGTMRKIEYNALRNDVLHVLVKQDTVPEDLHLDLIAMYLDAEQDDVWRTYSAQFLPIYWEARWTESESSPPPSPGVAENEAGYSTPPDALAREGIRDTLREALKERHNSVAGTVLIGMNDLRKSRNAFSEDEIREAAIEIALDTNASEASRVTALRICGQLGADEILEETRFLAQAGHTGMLRLAAMATLGDLGDRQDANLLSALAEENERFKTVTATAITKINRR